VYGRGMGLLVESFGVCISRKYGNGVCQTHSAKPYLQKPVRRSGESSKMSRSTEGILFASTSINAQSSYVAPPITEQNLKPKASEITAPLRRCRKIAAMSSNRRGVAADETIARIMPRYGSHRQDRTSSLIPQI
jgi:hypothetical protein